MAGQESNQIPTRAKPGRMGHPGPNPDPGKTDSNGTPRTKSPPEQNRLEWDTPDQIPTRAKPARMGHPGPNPRPSKPARMGHPGPNPHPSKTGSDGAPRNFEARSADQL